jgi:tetratricopeptide (TPR) repeat protein
VPQGSGSLEWLRPEIIHLVFSPHHGLFTWTPLFVFICAGAVPFCRRRPRYGIAFAVILFLQLYINSIFNWWGGWAFGVRRITDLFPIAVIFLGSFIGYVSQRRSRPVRSVVWLFLALCAAWTVLLFLNMKFAISGEEYLNLGGLISLQFRGITHIGMLLREAAVSSPWLSPEGWCALPLLLLTTLLALYLAGSIQRDDTARSLVRGFVFYCGGIAVLFAAVALRPLHAEALLPENEAGTLRNMTRLKKEPESLTTLGEIAKSAYALGLYHQSIRYQDRILERQPDNAQALFGKGIAMLYLDKDREAAAVFDTLRALTPDDPRALHYRGVCAAKRHDHEKALTFHKNAVKADPAYGAAYEAIGRCYEKMGLRYAARFAYQRAYNLSSMPLEKPEDKRDDDADQQAGGEGKIKPDVPPFDEDIAGETPQPGNGAPQP